MMTQALVLIFLSGISHAQFLREPPDTEAYRNGALRSLLREANQVATALGLPEKLPITEKDLTEKYICSPRIAQDFRAIGTITTSNYVYCVSRDNKLCYIVDAHQEEKLQNWQNSYRWPTNRVEQVGPYLLATQWLRQASMDVGALNRDCVLTFRVEATFENGERFLPAYFVSWIRGEQGNGAVASVRLFLPTRTLLQLRVEDPKYNLRPSVIVTNLDPLPTPSTK